MINAIYQRFSPMRSLLLPTLGLQQYTTKEQKQGNQKAAGRPNHLAM
jgi:hypothetical protein